MLNMPGENECKFKKKKKGNILLVYNTSSCKEPGCLSVILTNLNITTESVCAIIESHINSREENLCVLYS